MGDVKRRDVDTGWAWVVLVASMSTMTIMSAVDTSHGIFQEQLVVSFSGSYGTVALIFSMAFGGRYLFGPVSGIMSDLVTSRMTTMVGGALICMGMLLTSYLYDLTSIFFVYGVLCGAGSGLAFTASMSVVSAYFDKYRTVAFGISMGAPGIGMLACPYLLRWLIDDFGWRLAMGYFACIVAQVCVLSSLFFPHDPSRTPSCCCTAGHTPMLKETVVSTKTFEDPGDNHEEKTALLGGPRPHSMSQRIKNLLHQNFLRLVCLNQFLFTAGFATAFNFFPAYAENVGVAFQDLPTLYTAYGISMIIARLAGGFLFTLLQNHLVKVLFVLETVYALVQGLLPFYGVSFQTLFVERIFGSMAYGCSLLLIGPLLVHYLGPVNLPVTFGLTMMCSGLGSVVAPPIAGSLYDLYGDYNVCYYLAGSLSAISALTLILLAFIQDPRTSQCEADYHSTERLK